LPLNKKCNGTDTGGCNGAGWHNIFEYDPYQIKLSNMGDVKNISRDEANKKIKEIAEDTDICLFATALTQLPIAARPMSTQKVDDDGSIWFFSQEGSDKNIDIAKNDRVQLFYGNSNSSEYLSLYGHAEITKDVAKAKELWTPVARTWFNDGPEDPTLTLIRVVPEDGYYWDTKNGKLVTLLKMAAGAVTGREMDGGIQGHLNP